MSISWMETVRTENLNKTLTQFLDDGRVDSAVGIAECEIKLEVSVEMGLSRQFLLEGP